MEKETCSESQDVRCCWEWYTVIFLQMFSVSARPFSISVSLGSLFSTHRLYTYTHMTCSMYIMNVCVYTHKQYRHEF